MVYMQLEAVFIRKGCNMKEFIEKLIGRLEEKENEAVLKAPNTSDISNVEYQKWMMKSYGFKESIEIVNQLAEEYKGNLSENLTGWIPCSEKLPDKEEFLRNDGRFIVTDGNRRYQSIYDIYQGGFRTLVLSTNGGIERGWNFEVDNCVIAWQPLPETYQPKGE